MGLLILLGTYVVVGMIHFYFHENGENSRNQKNSVPKIFLVFLWDCFNI